MNATFTATTTLVPADDLVIEELSQDLAEEFLPGTCICWTEATGV
ncbi:hypothetical protein RCO28_26305 [Streptomyces sp. LHD-70]|nr:hypothetical protein [Streptomyces sp. LHD-70]MDQ8705969.1 hypothetical protein [Streptomyces sp. LHD-70]